MNWYLNITKAENGYVLRWSDEDEYGAEVIHTEVVEDDERDQLKSGVELLYRIMEYFGFLGSKHDEERIRVVRVGRDGKEKK